jgi:DNA-binding NarL/FixJ family response regulator
VIEQFHRQAPPATILVVDDEPLNVDYLEQELGSRGFMIETAADGLEALERIAAARIDLVLLDVMMPGMDGIETLRVLKADPETRLTPVVLMTALNSVDDRVRGIEAGADDFLTKPVDDRELLARIGTALTHKRAIDETVGELDRTRAHLERHGSRQREVAVLAVDWRFPSNFADARATAFMARRQRSAAEERIHEHGGIVCDDPGAPLVAVFDGADGHARAITAVEVALAVRAEATEAGDADLVAAVAAGDTWVGSVRAREDGSSGWRYAAHGQAVDRAVRLSRAPMQGGVVTAHEVRWAARDHFRFSATADGQQLVLGPAVKESAPERRVGTMVLADMVGSTGLAETLGDRVWGRVLIDYRRVLREEFDRHGGEQIDAVGDAVLGLFDCPSRALAAAIATGERLGELGLAFRAGVHTGEVERAGAALQGIAVNLTSRISARARPGEVLASATARELAAGAPLCFTDRGVHTLKGVAEPRRLYAVTRAKDAPASDEGIQYSGYPAGFTGRELEVLQLLVAGLSNAEVADRLVLSVRTVHAHVRSIYRKAGVRSRAAAVRFALEKGVIQAPYGFQP